MNSISAPSPGAGRVPQNNDAGNAAGEGVANQLGDFRPGSYSFAPQRSQVFVDEVYRIVKFQMPDEVLPSSGELTELEKAEQNLELAQWRYRYADTLWSCAKHEMRQQNREMLIIKDALQRKVYSRLDLRAERGESLHPEDIKNDIESKNREYHRIKAECTAHKEWVNELKEIKIQRKKELELAEDQHLVARQNLI